MAAYLQQKQLDDLYGLIQKIETAMLTTRRRTGGLYRDRSPHRNRDKSKPMVLFEGAKRMVTASTPDVGETRKLQMQV